MSPQEEIVRYLATGKHDPVFAAWPQRSLLDRAQHGNQDLRQALIEEVRTRVPVAEVPPELAGLDVEALTRRKVEPMVQGLFPSAEQPAVLAMLSRSVVFLTPCRVEAVLRRTSFPGTAWDLANLYLLSFGAAPLSDTAPDIVGLSEDTTCYVSVAYLQSQRRFDDYVVHEAAHVFHNSRRETLGLPTSRGRQWLLAIDFGKRETFAYACETYSRLLSLGATAAARRRLLEEAEDECVPNDDRVDLDAFIGVLRVAVKARNGWKRILEGCAPPRHRIPASAALQP
jgi:hypothetical protein